MKKAIMFIDLDGTILDVSDRVYQIYKDVLKKHNEKHLSKRIYLKLRKDNLPIPKILKLTKAEKIFSIFKKEAKEKIEKKYYLSLNKLPEKRRKALLRIKKHYKLVLITLRNDKKMLKAELKEKGIYNIFEKLLVAPAKNHHLKWKIKYKLIKNFGFNKNSILVGDTKTDIIAAKKLGIKAFAALWGMQKRDSLEKYRPDFLINNLSEILKCNF